MKWEECNFLETIGHLDKEGNFVPTRNTERCEIGHKIRCAKDKCIFMRHFMALGENKRCR